MCKIINFSDLQKRKVANTYELDLINLARLERDELQAAQTLFKELTALPDSEQTQITARGIMTQTELNDALNLPKMNNRIKSKYRARRKVLQKKCQ